MTDKVSRNPIAFDIQIDGVPGVAVVLLNETGKWLRENRQNIPFDIGMRAFCYELVNGERGRYRGKDDFGYVEWL